MTEVITDKETMKEQKSELKEIMENINGDRKAAIKATKTLSKGERI